MHPPCFQTRAALKRRFKQDGYVYVPGLIAPRILLELRRQIVEICEACGWLKPGTDPMDAISWKAPTIEGEEAYFEVYDRVQCLQDFHALAHEPAVLGLMQALLGDTAFPHPLSIARLVFPEMPDWSTPPHQDYVNNQGTSELYACWIPSPIVRRVWVPWRFWRAHTSWVCSRLNTPLVPGIARPACPTKQRP